MVKRQAGVTYLALLFVLAMMTGGLALAGEIWNTSAMREKEAELLQVGNEYRKAVERYYLSGAQRQYPKSLDDLVKDPRQPGTVRHLRRRYPDPITGKDEWGLVKSADGGFAGVYSLSESAPLKTGGFAVRDAAFEGKTRYADWQFVFYGETGAGTAANTGAGGSASSSEPAASRSVVPSGR